jgi:hypothetical protein
MRVCPNLTKSQIEWIQDMVRNAYTSHQIKEKSLEAIGRYLCLATISRHTKGIRQQMREEALEQYLQNPDGPGHTTSPISAAPTPARLPASTGLSEPDLSHGYEQGFRDGQAVLRAQIIQSLLALDLPLIFSCDQSEASPCASGQITATPPPEGRQTVSA